MNKQQIKHITNSHYRKIKKHSKEVAENFNAEAIHQLRVEYKKLRAFLRLLSHGNSQAGEIKISKKLKHSYTVSGSIRDLQLQQQRILEATKKEPKKPLAYLNLLQREIDNLKPELIEIFLEDPVAESKKKTDASIPDELPLTAFKDFAKQKWAIVYSIIISGHWGDENIHAIRKILKDLFYNLKVYEGVEHEILSVSIWKEKNEEYFDTLLNELGSFQDQCIAIALLKSYWLISLNTYNRELLEKIKAKWIKDKINMKQALLKKLKADILPQQTIPKQKKAVVKVKQPDYNHQHS
jgi:CHAD domain-containing protein